MKNKKSFGVRSPIKSIKINKTYSLVGTAVLFGVSAALAVPISLSQNHNNAKAGVSGQSKSMSTHDQEDKTKMTEREALLGELYEMPLTNVDEVEEYAGVWWYFMLKYENKTNFEALTLSEKYRLAFEKNTYALADNAFENVTFPAGFRLPDNIVSIGSYAFRNAKLAGGITIPKSVTKIGTYAFYNADLTKGLKLQDGIKNLWDNAFQGAKLPSEFKLPDTIMTIGVSSLAQVTLPANFKLPSGLIQIDSYAFYKSTLPTGFAIPAGVTKLSNNCFEQASLNSDFAIPTSVLTIEANAFNMAIVPNGYKWFLDGQQLDNPQPGAKLQSQKDIMLYDLNAMTVTNEMEMELYLGFWSIFMLDHENLTSDRTKVLTDKYRNGFKDDINSLASFTFKDEHLPAGFRLPNKITKIQHSAFEGASFAMPLIIPDTVNSLGNYVFLRADLTKGFVFPRNVADAWPYAFQEAKLADDFRLPPTVTKIGAATFSYVNLPAGFNLPAGVRTIEKYAFFKSTLPQGFVIPEGVVLLTDHLFGYVMLNGDFVIPDSVKEISASTFEGASLNVNFAIPGTVTKLDATAFLNAVLPANCSWVLNNKLINAPTIGAKVQQVTSQLISDTFIFDETTTSLVNADKAQFVVGREYSTSELGIAPVISPSWAKILKYEVVDNTVEGEIIVNVSVQVNDIVGITTLKIKGFMLTRAYALSRLLAMKITNATEVNAYATAWENFMVNYEKRTATQAKTLSDKYRAAFKNNVNILGESAFKDEFIPWGFKLPDAIAKIEHHAFQGVTFAMPLIIPDNVAEIGMYAFAYSDLTKGFALPSRISSISNFSFRGAKLANDFKLPSTVTTIGDGAFSEATLNVGFVIPSNVATLNASTFENAKFPTACRWILNGKLMPTPIADASIKMVTRDVIFNTFDFSNLQTSLKNTESGTIGLGVHTAAQLGIITPSLHSGVTFNHYIVIDNHLSGQLGVEVSLSFEDITATKSFLITGFKSQREEDLAILNALPLNDESEVETYTEAWERFMVNYESESPSDAKKLVDAYRNAFSAGVSIIKVSAFNGLHLVVGFRIPEGTTAIRGFAFANAYLPLGFVIPDNVFNIVPSAFENVQLPPGAAWFDRTGARIDEPRPGIGANVKLINS